jgi:integrase/recombinase XerD
MNCNEEFVVKALGKLTLEFNFDWQQQRKISEILHLCLYNYDVLSQETGLVASDLKEKIRFYLEVRKLENYSNATLKNYLYTLGHFALFINKPVATINKNDLRYYLACLAKDKNLKASTMNNKISSLKAFFQWLEDEEIIPRNPARQISATKLPKRLRSALSIEELERLRLACKDVRERSLVEFIFATGCRVSEVVNVNIEDLNLYNNTLRVIGKGDKERVVCFSDKTKLHLKNYIDSRKDANPALFISSKFPFDRMGKRGIEVIISKLGKKAKISRPVFPHLLRHTMATLGLQAGADLTTIQHLLGHTVPSTTQIYAEQNIDNIKHEYKQHFIQ